MAGPINSYYNRFDPEKNYQRHMFRAGMVLQSAELNEIQDAGAHRLRSIGDALFKDGDIVRDARIVVDQNTGDVTCESGAIYLDGMVRGVPPGSMKIPLTGTVLIGIYLQESVVTEKEDPDLLDPAAETRNYNEPGAVRLKVDPVWGFQGDEQTGDFFPIYYVDDGLLRGKEAPPVLDSVSQAIARYDRDSTGSNYVVSGLNVSMLADADGNQVYSVTEGRAYVNGWPINLATSRRVTYPAQPVLQFVDSEPKVSDTLSLQRVNVDRPPVKDYTQVRITRQETVDIVRGPASGTSDVIPEQAVVDIVSITQGSTTYVKGTDYKLTGGQVDWSLSGAEPATGSTYECTFQYITAVTPQDPDEKGFSVLGAVPGTLIMTSYNSMLPRIDRLCVTQDGELKWIEGVSTAFNPVRPQVPQDVLALAQVVQTWDDRRSVINDGVRVVPMNKIEAYDRRMDLLTDLIALNTLKTDAGTREAIAKKGLFVDPFIDDQMRDLGIEQTASSADGTLSLPIAATPFVPTNDVTKREVCAYELETVLSNTERTGSMKVNPYLAFDIMPSEVTLTPAVDRWQEVSTRYTSPVTNNFTVFDPGWHGPNLFYNVVTTETRQVGSTSGNIPYLRQIDVSFQIKGFGPNEQLVSMSFDGLPVDPVAP